MQSLQQLARVIQIRKKYSEKEPISGCSEVHHIYQFQIPLIVMAHVAGGMT